MKYSSLITSQKSCCMWKNSMTTGMNWSSLSVRVWDLFLRTLAPCILTRMSWSPPIGISAASKSCSETYYTYILYLLLVIQHNSCSLGFLCTYNVMAEVFWNKNTFDKMSSKNNATTLCKLHWLHFPTVSWTSNKHIAIWIWTMKLWLRLQIRSARNSELNSF